MTKLLCSPEEFIKEVNILLNDHSNESYNELINIFKQTILPVAKTNTPLANAYDLCIHICFMRLIPTSMNEPFVCNVQMNDSRSAIPSDFNSDQLDFVKKVINDIDNPLLKARLADLLWIILIPREPSYAHMAIKNYTQLSITPNNWYKDIKDCWERAVILTKQLKSKDSKQLDQIANCLLDIFNKDYPENGFFILSIANLIVQNNLCKVEYLNIANRLSSIAEQFKNQGAYREAREYFELCVNLFTKLDLEDKKQKTIALIAECYELEADILEKHDSGSIVTNRIYEQALQKYRQVSKKYRDILGITTRLPLIIDKISDTGKSILDELITIKSPPVNIESMIAHSVAHVSDKASLEEALQYFISFPFPKYKDLQEQVKKILDKNPIHCLFGSQKLSSDGRVIAKIPALDIGKPLDDNKEVLLNKTIDCFFLEIGLIVHGEILPALQQILSEHKVSKDFLGDLCYQSTIVPKDRIYLLASGLWLGFEQDFANSIHLLAPQVEHMVRQLFKSRGITTSTIDHEGIEQEIGLSSLLDKEEAITVLGEDYLFYIKAIFANALGYNLRNEVAHGLLSDQSANTVASVYAWWMILKLVILNANNKI